MILKWFTDWYKQNTETRRVVELRRRVSVGSQVSYLRPDHTNIHHRHLNATVMNVRNYYHGQIELYIVTNNHEFMGWVGIDTILPPNGDSL